MTNPTWNVRCIFCGAEQPKGWVDYCPDCGGVCIVVYGDKHDVTQSPNETGVFRYRYCLPLDATASNLGLQEGDTPLIPARVSPSDVQLFFKDETRNPTGSFKDRGMAVAVADAVAHSRSAVCTASSGNAAASLAFYSARSGIEAVVFVPEKTPKEKVASALVAGARVVLVPGSFAHAYQLARSAAAEFCWANITTTFMSPLIVEGYKTVAYEIHRDLSGVPDWVVVPTGAGPLIYGIYKGFVELLQAGVIERLPRLLLVQSAGCAPIVSAYDRNEPVRAWHSPATVAGAVADPLAGYEQDGEAALLAVRDSMGTCAAVDEDEIVQAVRQLARNEGLFVEPAGAVGYAASRRVKAWHSAATPDEETRIVVVLTGHGLKHPSSAISEDDVAVKATSLKDLKKCLREVAL